MVRSLLWCRSQATRGLSCATRRSCWQRGSRAQPALPSELRKQNGPKIRFPSLTLKPSLCVPKEKSCLHLAAGSTHPSEQLSQSSIPYQPLGLVHFSFLEKLPTGLEGEIPPPAISRRDFNNSRRIPDCHLPACALPKRGMNQSTAQPTSSILPITHVCSCTVRGKPSPEPPAELLPQKAGARSSLYTQHVTQRPDPNSPTRREPKLSPH